MFYNFFDTKAQGTGFTDNDFNLKLADELHKNLIRKFPRRKVEIQGIGQIWGADLADMQLISRQNKGIRFLLCVIDIYSDVLFKFTVKT